MKFFMKMDPPTVTAQEHKVAVVSGRPVFYDTPRIKEARRLLETELRRHKPSEPKQGPLYLLAEWRFPCGKSHKPEEYRITRPDTDNLQKLLKDCMTRVGFWKDDAQVAKETAIKKWSDEPCGIYIEVESLDDLSEVTEYDYRRSI